MFTHGPRAVTHPHTVDFGVIAHRASETNLGLAAAGWRGAPGKLLTPREALLRLQAGDVALNRLDVSPDLDGVEEGIWMVTQLEAQGVRVLNRPPALLASHDKLLTGRLLTTAGVPHPRTRRLVSVESADDLRYPVVAKPRFGSWGRDVELCCDRDALVRYLALVDDRPWWDAGGIVQELVPPQSSDLRVIVSGGSVVGAASRTPAAGEWRTNVALGGTSRRTVPPQEATDLALRATRSVGIDLAGVDLVPSDDGYVVLEVNGAVETKPYYSLNGDLFTTALRSLERVAEEPLLLA